MEEKQKEWTGEKCRKKGMRERETEQRGGWEQKEKDKSRGTKK